MCPLQKLLRSGYARLEFQVDSDVRFQVLIAVTLMIAVFSDVRSCSLVDR
jgi:hypothetical protein